MMTRFNLWPTNSLHALPLDLVRICLYFGLLLHMLPSLWYFQENYSADAVVRVFGGNALLYQWFGMLAPGWLVLAGGAMVLFLVLGLFGLWPRISAVGALLTVYFFHQGNTLNTQTLAMQVAYGMLMVFAVSGAGSSIWTLAPHIKLKRPTPVYENYAMWALLVFLLSTIFWAGIEKLTLGWAQDNRLYFYLASPPGVYVHDWVLSMSWLRAPIAGKILGYFILIVELAAPPLVLWRRTRKMATLGLLLMFICFVAVLQLPLLFTLLYLPMFLLILSQSTASATPGIYKNKNSGGT